MTQYIAFYNNGASEDQDDFQPIEAEDYQCGVLVFSSREQALDVLERTLILKGIPYEQPMEPPDYVDGFRSPGFKQYRAGFIYHLREYTDEC